MRTNTKKSKKWSPQGAGQIRRRSPRTLLKKGRSPPTEGLSIRLFSYLNSGLLPRSLLVWLRFGPCVATDCARLAKKYTPGCPMALWLRFSARLGSSGQSRDALGTLRGSIFEAGTTVSLPFVASDMHASARPPDPHETLRGRTNFKLRACCEGPNIGRKLASNAARRRVRAGNAIDKGPEATQEGQLGARDC